MKNKKLQKTNKLSTKTNIAIGVFAASQVAVALALQTDGKFDFTKSHTTHELVSQQIAMNEANAEYSKQVELENARRDERIKSMIGSQNVFSTSELSKEVDNYVTAYGENGQGVVYSGNGDVRVELSKDGQSFSQYADKVSNGDVLFARFVYGNSQSRSFSYTVSGLTPKEAEPLHATDDTNSDAYSVDDSNSQLFSAEEFQRGVDPSDNEAMQRMVQQAVARSHEDLSAAATWTQGSGGPTSQELFTTMQQNDDLGTGKRFESVINIPSSSASGYSLTSGFQTLMSEAAEYGSHSDPQHAHYRLMNVFADGVVSHQVYAYNFRVLEYNGDRNLVFDYLIITNTANGYRASSIKRGGIHITSADESNGYLEGQFYVPNAYGAEFTS